LFACFDGAPVGARGEQQLNIGMIEALQCEVDYPSGCDRSDFVVLVDSEAADRNHLQSVILEALANLFVEALNIRRDDAYRPRGAQGLSEPLLRRSHAG
jgi:hypothetical protein